MSRFRNSVYLLTCLVLVCGLGQNASEAAQAVTDKEAKRLQKAVMNILDIGVRPQLTEEEKAATEGFSLRFPMPKAGDHYLNFYARSAPGKPSKIVMPVQSLKMVEDLTTAYAWLYEAKKSLSTIDLYFAMLEAKNAAVTRSGGIVPILEALGIPKNALKNPKVDKLSLSLRNEAFAFILLHELGHVRFAHKGYDDITTEQARADEQQSDQFALEVMARTETPPLGAVLFFQAQAYAMPHRGGFDSTAAWERYQHKLATHPVSTDRIRGMARQVKDVLSLLRSKETAIWRFIGTQLEGIADTLDDDTLQKCIRVVARKADREVLLPRDGIAGDVIRQACGG
ncbi:MAG: M48 family metalloprotease [Hyphomicrobiaceae bacterium]